MIKIIACVGKNMEIGKAGGLCFNIPEDMKFFQKTTLGNPVVMGYRTWKSIGRPLKGRTNYVVTRESEMFPRGVNPVFDTDEIFQTFQLADTDMFAIGGASIYKAALPYAKEIYLTEVDAEDQDADTFFPEFDKRKYTRTVLGGGEHNGLKYDFVLYTKKKERKYGHTA